MALTVMYVYNTLHSIKTPQSRQLTQKADKNKQASSIINSDSSHSVAGDTYHLNTLIEQTRQVAADYRNSTGHALPVTAELARFDAISKLGLTKAEGEQSFDAYHQDGKTQCLIKGRVIFKSGKARQKLGQVNIDDPWDLLIMVVYDADYLPNQIYEISREIIEAELIKSPKDKRGSMTVAKYKAIGQLVWESQS